MNYRTAGESHGKGILALIEGFPAGMEIQERVINEELRRRQGGYGRGGRQNIETDQVEILSGVWKNITLGSPITLWVKNKDYRLPELEDLESPRPGHGDLSGSRKYLSSMRGILERASARETAGRVAAGALARQLLTELGIEVFGYVTRIGNVNLPVSQRAEELFSLLETGIDPEPESDPKEEKSIQNMQEEGNTEISAADTLSDHALNGSEEQSDSGIRNSALKLKKMREESALYSLAEDDSDAKSVIDAAQKEGDTLGGMIEVRATGLPFGLGTHTQWNEKLDGLLAQAVMSIQAIKAVEIGLGIRVAELPGSECHDIIRFNRWAQESSSCGFERPTNHAGGLEAGMTNTKPLVIRAAMKPIATLKKPLESVNLRTFQPQAASWERSDTCAVPAASVVMENVVAFTLAQAIIDKFGGDSWEELQARWTLYQILVQDMNGT
ncbi:MAG: chorismate synthase [Planctomycetia bacterium]|nr:chorismate synthase [Planctomycetia bacterium]